MVQDFSQFNSLIPSEIVYVCKKPMKAIAITQMLEKIGHKVKVLSGIYDAIKEIDSSLPRLVICEYEFPDGSIIHLLDKIENNPLTSHIPIVALLDSANSSNVALLKDRNVRAFFKSNASPKDIVIKSHTIATKENYSAYFKDISSLIETDEISLSMKMILKGKVKNLLVIESPKALELGQNVNVKKHHDEASKIIFKPIYNFELASSVLCFSPIHSLKGTNASWALGVNDLKSEEDLEVKPKVLVYCKDNYNKSGMVDLLNVSGFTAEGALTYDEVIRFISKNQKETVYGIVLEMPTNEDLIKFFKLYKTLKVKPRIIISSREPVAVAKNMVNLIQPYSLDSLLDSIKAVFAVDSKLKIESSSNVELELERSARIITMDSTGGVFESKDPITAGMELEVSNEEFTGFIRGQNIVKILACVESAGGYHVKFEVPGASENKMKFIEHLEKVIAEKSSSLSKTS